MTKVIYRIAVTALGSALIVGCQSMQAEESPVSSTLPPAQEPAPPAVGTVVHGIRNDEAVQTRVVAREGSVLTMKRPGGCQFTRDLATDVVFAPTTSWTDCYGSSGEIDITGKSGDIWPLEVGSSVSFDATGTSSNSSSDWPADYECETVDQVRISVAAGTFDTYKVSCSTPWRGQTIYYAPSVERAVKFIQWPKNQSNANRYDWEFVRADLP